jgi:hypothetical protein
MRRIALLAASVAMLLFALAPAGQALVVFNEDVWFQFSGPTLCGSKDILFEGTNHILINSTEDQAGGSHLVVHYNFEKTEGVGLTSGDGYTIRQIDNGVTNAQPLDPAETTNTVESTAVLRGSVIHLGEKVTQTDDIMVLITAHITQNANGEVTNVYFEDIVCN